MQRFIELIIKSIPNLLETYNILEDINPNYEMSPDDIS